MAIDMEQFHQVFFEESLEGLDIMEQALLSISEGVQPDPEVINTIFRAAHSIKGGSGTFGFTEIADFTHVLETLLDEAREGKRSLGTDAVDLLLKSGDCLKVMVESLQAGEAIDNSAALPLVKAFEAMLTGQPVAVEVPDPPADTIELAGTATSAVTANNETSQPSPEPPMLADPHDLLAASFDTLLVDSDDNLPVNLNTDQAAKATAGKLWRISFKPEPQILMTGNEPLRLFRELAAMGELRTEADFSGLPQFDLLTPDECHIHWTLWLTADVERNAIEEVFDWVMDECQLDIELQENSTTSVGSEPVVEQPTVADVTPIPGADEVSQSAAAADTDKTSQLEAASNKVEQPLADAPTVTPAMEAKKPATAAVASGAATSSIRVGIDKVDSLINLVGELVITQSMLSELGGNFDMSKLERLSTGLEQLQQNTRELQESVMRIRMLPISFAFNRFPRMIRDLSAKTGKKVELKLSGENTELDKTVMEQISDPLVHLVRNAIDHGLEMPDTRLAAGKSETGTIHLDAYHKGGNIVIEIRDDGNGIDPDIILNKARDKGVVTAEQQLSRQEIFELIFEPGFSTAAEVTDISGRGVGMDVVRRNIYSLGGRIEIDSELGAGSIFRVHLPLTLAILDGQLVRVGSEIYIIPLVAIVESLQIKRELVNKVSGNMVVYRLREDNVPIIPIHEVFNIETEPAELVDSLLVVVEGDGQKVGLLVDDLLAQQQVVIKSLETNYKRVDGVSGATILGDGSVSMILDVPGLIRGASDSDSELSRSRNQHQAA